MEEILNPMIKIAAAVLVLAVSCLAERVGTFLQAKKAEKADAKLDKFIGELVAAAEQMLKQGDEDGSGRLSYVENALTAAGYELTAAVRAKIESCVYAINRAVSG